MGRSEPPGCPSRGPWENGSQRVTCTYEKRGMPRFDFSTYRHNVRYHLIKEFGWPETKATYAVRIKTVYLRAMYASAATTKESAWYINNMKEF